MATLGRSPGAAPLTTADIPDNSITAAKIVEGTITVGDIGTDAVGTDEIADDAVTGAKIENNPTIAGNLTVSGDLVPSTPLSHRNMIINGAMNVAQRGSTAHASSTYGAVDRFRIFLDSTEGRVTTTQDSESPAGFSSSLKVDCTTIVSSVDAGDLVTVAQVIEAQNLQHLDYGSATAKDMVLSFWIRSPKSGVHCVDMMQNDNSNKTIIREFTVASANTWEKFSVLIPGDTSGVINNDNDRGLTIHWTLVAGSDYTNHTLNAWTATSGGGEKTGSSNQQNLLDNTANNFYLTGVQLELGSNATPFEHRSYGEELLRCQRYYQRNGGDANMALASGASISSSGVFAQGNLVCTMRGTISMTFDTLWLYGSQNSNMASGSLDYQHPSSTCIGINASSASTPFDRVGEAQMILTNSDAGYMAFDAEL